MANDLYITVKHTGKMAGMQSMSTSCLCNSNCEKNRNIPGSICQQCYATTMSKRYGQLNERHMNNSAILSNSIIPEKDLPIINAAFFRFEAFGDLINTTHLINYINIAKKNKYVNFALWTKCLMICDQVFNKLGVKKPKNLKIIASSLMINKPITKPEWADATFTVWNSEKAASDAGKKINCGSRQCITCLKCYTKNSTTEINELLKSEQRKNK